MSSDIRFVERLVQFAQADLGGISTMEKKKWFHEKMSIIRGYFDDRFYTEIPPHTEEEWIEVVSFQGEWLRCLNWVIDHLSESWRLEFDVVHIFEWGAREEKGEFWSGEKRERHDSSNIRVSAIREVAFAKEPILGIQRPEDIVFPGGALHFFEALSGFPTSSVLRCTHCDRIFFNSSRRRKLYCSARCQNTAGVKRLRAGEEAKKNGSVH